MQLSMRLIVLLNGFLLTGLLANAQDEQAFQSFTQQGQRYEKQGYYSKAIDAYRQAQANAAPADRKSIGQTIDRLNELNQQQALVNQAQADEIRRQISGLNSPKNRKRLQVDLTVLQQRDNATQADYQNLLRRVEAAKEVEIELTASTETAPTKKPVPVSPQPRRLAAPRPAGPPPKTITVSMPEKIHNDAALIKPARNPTRSIS